ncbi:MAG: ATP-binding protein [Victivallales bacterium]|nr:ATP-binding protein [Victivallales bacterium]
MSNFHYNKKIEHESAAEVAIKREDFNAAFIHITEAAKHTLALAKQCTGDLAKAYLRNANELMDLAEKSRSKVAGSNGVTADGDKKQSAASRCCLVERPSVRLDDVAGMDDVKRQIRLRMIEPLQHPEEAQKHGLKTGGGILLYGPPGTGKTFIAKAVAGELGLPFYTITPADVFGKYVGESENNIRALFAEARKNPLSIVFIDELESIFRKRTADIHETTQKVISVILQELDGVKDGKNPFLLMGATNAPWLIDEAFLRTGRFDVKAYVGLPDLPAREQIIRNAFKNVEYPVDEDAIMYLASATGKCSGADINGIVQCIRQTAFDHHLDHYTIELFRECTKHITPSCNEETQRKIEEWERQNEIVGE